MPRPRDYQNHLLQLEETLFGHGWRTSPATQRPGRGKQKAQKHVRRPDPWQQNAQGSAFKKVVSPRDWRELQRPKSLGRPNARKGYSGIRDSREKWDILLSIFNPDAPCKMPISSDSIALSVRMY
jgi:hypothetical protein